VLVEGVGEIGVVTTFPSSLGWTSSPYGTSLYGAWVPDVVFPGSRPENSDADEAPRCSAKGCRAPAEFDLQWRNPRLHDAARVKHWLACAEHVDSLSEYLAARSFLLGRETLER